MPLAESLNGQAVEAPVLVRVWDLPTRLFHWLLALGVVASIVTARIGGGAMTWHFRIGYVIFALLAFRLFWGLRRREVVALSRLRLRTGGGDGDICEGEAPRTSTTMSATARSAPVRCSRCSA